MNTKIFLLAAFLLVFVSCDKFLDPYPNGDRSEEDIWLYQDMVQGLIGQCYDNMPKNYDNNEGTYLDGATDDAIITSSTHTLRRMATAAITTNQDPFRTYWERDYRSINLVNKFLQNRRGYNTKFMLDSLANSLIRSRLQGEAFALRAWFQWDLLQKFGGKGSNGEMLGFPIVTEPLDINTGVNLARNTYDECVAQIIADCDSAYKYLPIAHRDVLVPAADRSYAGGKYWGRFDGITTRAIKAMVYLTWASPRFNPSNDIARWDSAASNAKKVINFKLTIDNVTNGFKQANQVNWLDPNFPGIVFSSRVSDKNDAMERMFYPGGFQGNGVIGASQELVNSFGMANGRPITDPLSGYNPSNPYVGRDPRFYSAIFFNNADAKKNNTGSAMYTFENWSNGGKDAAGVKSSNSLSNYHIKKFVYMGLNWSDATINRQPHSKFFIRWAHMVLTFAEAANHVTQNPNTALYGLTPKAAIKYLRARKTYDGLTPTFASTDPYLDSQTTEAAFDALVKNERRIETCFEGMRFYDLRRWTTDADWQSVINQPVHGAAIVLNPDNTTFTYNLNNEIEPRSFPSPYLPIPYEELLRMSNLVQNEGWEYWN